MKYLQIRLVLLFVFSSLMTGFALANTHTIQPSSTISLDNSNIPPSLPSDVSTLERHLNMIEHELSETQQTIDSLKAKNTVTSERIHKYGRHLYKITRAGLLPLRGGFESFVDHAQHVEALRSILLRDHRAQQEQQTRLATLTNKLHSLANERALLIEHKKRVEAEKIAAEQEHRRRKAFEQAFTTLPLLPTSIPIAPIAKRDITVYSPSGQFDLESNDDLSSFRLKKGQLMFPVVGEAQVQSITKEGEPAVEFHSHTGTTVRAVHMGRVVFADTYSTYGQLVILDQEDRYFTVSANLGSIDVKTGETIAQGQRIGTVGTNATVHFEIRHGAQKLPPKEWFGF